MNVPGSNAVVVLVTIILQIIFCYNVSTTVLVTIGETVSLKCLINTSNTLAFEWNHKGETIFLHDRNFVGEKRKGAYTASLVSERNIYQLDIFVHGSENLGTFDCIQYSSTEKSAVSWNLKERVKQYSSIGSNITTVMVGNSVEFDCSQNANTAFSVHWEHNGIPIRQENFSNAISDYHPFRLFIDDVRLKDAGNYSCFSFFTKGRNITAVWSVLVKDNEPDEYTVTASLGNSVNITCELDQSKGNLAAVNWNHGSNEILHHDASQTEVTKDKYTSKIASNYSMIQLNILIVGFADCGEYSCISFLKSGASTKKTWILHLKGKRNAAEERLLPVHGSTELNCYSDNPRDVTAVKWIRNRKVIKDTKITGYNIEKTFNDDPHTSYNITNASFKEAGNYFCFSYYKNHSSQETAWTVQVQGNTTLTLSTSTLNERETVATLCCVEFGMTPMSYEIYWLLDGRNFNFDGKNTNFGNKNTTYCNRLEFPLERRFHGKSLDCLVQNELNRTASIILAVFYPPRILNIQHRTTFSLSSNEEVYITCTVDAHPDPVVILEKKSTKGSWEEQSRSPVLKSRNNTIVEWRFSLSERGKHSYRCIAYNTNSSTATSQEILTNCFWPCLFNGIGDVVLFVSVGIFGMIVIITIIFNIAAPLKGTGGGLAVSTPVKRKQRPESGHMACSPDYENFSGVKTSQKQQVPVSVTASGELVGDENYSLVTTNETRVEHGDGKELDKANDGTASTFKGSNTRVMEHKARISQNQTRSVNRKATPRRKPKQRRNQRKLSENLNETPAAVQQQQNVLYATVNKQKPVPSEIVQYATVQKPTGTAEGDNITSSHANRGAPPPLSIADSMYGKVKKKKIWRTDQ